MEKREDSFIFSKNMMERKMNYVGHVLRDSSEESLLHILEGRVSEMRPKGRPRLT